MALHAIPNDKELLCRVAEGDQQAFTTLFNAYYKTLGEYIFRVTESEEAAQEIVQDTFLKIWEKRETLTDVDNFSGYLFIISKNKTLKYLRQAAKEQARLQAWYKEIIEGSNASDNALLLEEYSIIIENTVSKLPRQQRMVYCLSRHEQLKYEEIADRMGLSKETVKKHMKLALSFLKKNVKRQIENAVSLALFLSSIL